MAASCAARTGNSPVAPEGSLTSVSRGRHDPPFGKKGPEPAPCAAPALRCAAPALRCTAPALGHSEPALRCTAPALGHSAPVLACTAAALRYSALALRYSASALPYTASALGGTAPVLRVRSPRRCFFAPGSRKNGREAVKTRLGSFKPAASRPNRSGSLKSPLPGGFHGISCFSGRSRRIGRLPAVSSWAKRRIWGMEASNLPHAAFGVPGTSACSGAEQSLQPRTQRWR